MVDTQCCKEKVAMLDKQYLFTAGFGKYRLMLCCLLNEQIIY